MTNSKQKTTVGTIDRDVLAFTAGEDYLIDHALIVPDCLGTAAHVRMLAAMHCKPPILSETAAARVVKELYAIMEKAAVGTFKITLADQDVHMAVERELTKALGDLGKKVHTGRSRNDQSALDLRLYARAQLLGLLGEVADLCKALLKTGQRHALVPMVGRTHQQPAMPSSFGLWASAHAESLLEDAERLEQAYILNNRCPLGAAASYGVPLPLNRNMTAKALGFDVPIHNTLYAINARGKNEAAIVDDLSQVMISLSRLAEDMLMFSMPEFGYFSWPAELGTGSSIMPQKNNPDVLELIRAKSSNVRGLGHIMADIVRGLPSGYSRDVQETKAPFMQAFYITRSSVRIMCPFAAQMKIDRAAMKKAFTGGVFATDRALEMVADGAPFRAAYEQVKKEWHSLEAADPDAAVKAKTHEGAPAGLDWTAYGKKASALASRTNREARRLAGLYRKLMGKPLPGAGHESYMKA